MTQADQAERDRTGMLLLDELGLDMPSKDHTGDGSMCVWWPEAIDTLLVVTSTLSQSVEQRRRSLAAKLGGTSAPTPEAKSWRSDLAALGTAYTVLSGCASCVAAAARRSTPERAPFSSERFAAAEQTLCKQLDRLLDPHLACALLEAIHQVHGLSEATAPTSTSTSTSTCGGPQERHATVQQDV